MGLPSPTNCRFRCHHRRGGIRRIWAVRASSKAEPARSEWIYKPNLFLIVFVVALLMLLHTLTIAELAEILAF
jgi:hypothetical protein